MMRMISGLVMVCAALNLWSAGLDQELNQPQRWTDNASGVTKRSVDAAEKAMRFDFTFKGNGDRWAYPTFKIAAGESLVKSTEISFEIKLSQPEKGAAWKAAFLMFHPKGGKIALPAPTGEWQTVTIDLTDPALKLDRNELRGIRIGANPTCDRFSMLLRNVKIKGAEGILPQASCVVHCEAPGNVFTENESLKFQVVGSRILPDALSFSIRNFWGEELLKGQWPQNGTLTLDALPRGYYTMKLMTQTETLPGVFSFSILADPALRKPNPNSPFALDTALSWLGRADRKNPRFSEEGFDLLIEILRRAGVGAIRERLLWKEVQPARTDRIDWKHYKRNADKLCANGVDILGLVHDSPAWAQYKPQRGNTPDDLLEVFRFSRALATDFKGRMGAWEFWNEPDHNAHCETPWDLAAAQKAASLGFRAGDPKLILLQGSFCTFPLSSYFSIFMQNGTADYFDVFNYHAYRALARYPEIVADIRRSMKEFGIDGMPIYLTESGTNAEGQSRARSAYPGQAETDDVQDRLLSEFIVKSPILFHATGVARNYFFVFPAYHERSGSKDWGMLRRDYSAKPQLAAFATLVAELDRAEYQGEYALGKKRRGFLFQQPDGSQTLVVWLESNLDRVRHDSAVPDQVVADESFSLPFTGKLECVDLMGRVRHCDAKKLPISRYPGYIRGLSGLKSSDKPVSFGNIHRKDSGRELGIVFKFVFLKGFRCADDRSCMFLTEKKGTIRLEIFNLTDQVQQGMVSVSGLPGAEKEFALEIPAMNKKELFLEIESSVSDSAFSVKGIFGGRPVSGAMVPIRTLAVLDNARSVALENTPSRWRNNSSGKSEILAGEGSHSITVRTQFPGGDNWSYPEYRLRLPEESLEKALAIRFDIRANPALLRQANLMLVESTEKELGRTAILPFKLQKADWQTVTILLPGNKRAIKMLRIGVNPRVNDYSFELRNPVLLYAR